MVKAPTIRGVKVSDIPIDNAAITSCPDVLRLSGDILKIKFLVETI